MKAKKNTLDNDWSVYPMLKLFKGDFLLEVGYNNKTKLDAHLMYRFQEGSYEKLLIFSVFIDGKPWRSKR